MSVFSTCHRPSATPHFSLILNVFFCHVPIVHFTLKKDLVYNIFVFVERYVIFLNDIEVKNLKKRFGDFDALKDISIEIKSGEFLAILGPNGAGKSTFLKIMTTLLKGYDGKVEICGYDIEKYPKKVREQIGVVPENFILYDRLTAMENMVFFGELYHLSRETALKRAEKLLKDVEMWEWRNKKVENFSFGMKQRVNIVRALMNDPKVVFLDEPTASLDIKSALTVKKLLKEINALNKTIVFTTHILSEVEELATKIAILNFGQLVAFGAPDELSIMAEDQKDLIVEIEKNDSKNYKAFFDKSGIKLEITGNTMKFMYSDGNELEKIIKLISESKIPLRSINSSDRNFNRIFLKLTDKGRDKN
jgi:ABC-2 type transport system ATP-binding protein